MKEDIPPGTSILQILVRRRSGRTFDAQRRVEPETVLTLLEAARAAPSSFNEQPWRFLVFDGADPEALEKARSCLSEGNGWARQAPLLLLSVAAERWRKDGSSNRHAQHDVGMASENLALEATALGLTVHFMAGFDAERARELFGIPEGFTPMAMVAVGFPGRVEDLPPRLQERETATRRRIPISEIAYAGRWERPYAPAPRKDDSPERGGNPSR